MKEPRTASLLSTTLGGGIGWFIFLKVLPFTSSALFSPLIEPRLVSSMLVQVSVTAIAIFAVLSVVIVALSHLRWWMHWLAFVGGILICIAMRVHPQGIELTIDAFLRTALVSAVLSSGTAAHLISYLRNRGISAAR